MKKQAATVGGIEIRKKPLSLRIWNNRGYYLMFLPVLVFLIIMYYWPMLGVRYAFYDYKPVGTPAYVGFKHFQKMFATKDFWRAFTNTLELSIVRLIITNVSAVIVSLFLNERKICLQRRLCRLLYTYLTSCHGRL